VIRTESSETSLGYRWLTLECTRLSFLRIARSAYMVYCMFQHTLWPRRIITRKDIFFRFVMKMNDLYRFSQFFAEQRYQLHQSLSCRPSWNSSLLSSSRWVSWCLRYVQMKAGHRDLIYSEAESIPRSWCHRCHRLTRIIVFLRTLFLWTCERVIFVWYMFRCISPNRSTADFVAIRYAPSRMHYACMHACILVTHICALLHWNLWSRLSDWGEQFVLIFILILTRVRSLIAPFLW
jgi:hypothetical protein